MADNEDDTGKPQQNSSKPNICDIPHYTDNDESTDDSVDDNDG